MRGQYEKYPTKNSGKKENENKKKSPYIPFTPNDIEGGRGSSSTCLRTPRKFFKKISTLYLYITFIAVVVVMVLEENKRGESSGKVAGSSENSFHAVIDNAC